MTGYINIFHLALVAPLFIYIGISRDQVHDYVFYALGLLGAIILVYHAYKAYLKLTSGQSAWINWIHILFVAPLLMLLGYLKKDASRRYFEMLLMLGFAALGYHGFYIVRDMIIQ
jgi:hypothetical protein